MLHLSTFISLVLIAPLAAAVIPAFGQCGGIGYTGDTECSTGLICTRISDDYYQCQRPGPTLTPSPTPTISLPVITPTPPGSLDVRLKAHGLKFWGVWANNSCLNNASCTLIMRSQYGAITPDNDLKWDTTEPSRGQLNFTGADVLVNWAVSNHKLVNGYALVWHSQLPNWVSSISDSTTLTLVIQNHIANVAGRYKGNIYSWVVVNEVLNEDGTLRSSIFSDVLGESFIPIAFRAARAADPAAKLYINDYNLDFVNTKVQSIIGLVNRINANGILIDGIGTETHLYAGIGGTSRVQAALTALASATVKEISITELDIERAASDDYVTVVKACLNTPKCASINNFCVSDADSWRPNFRPCLFDFDYQPKPAFNAILSALV
ncbi:hypothetical protein AX16_006368 [Volvariella volvacea WC 439]|nr:hypothetical protein AX16_006368 [Volvariella volvacea WC 439]